MGGSFKGSSSNSYVPTPQQNARLFTTYTSTAPVGQFAMPEEAQMPPPRCSKCGYEHNPMLPCPVVEPTFTLGELNEAQDTITALSNNR